MEELLHQYGYQRRRSNSAPSSPLLELVFHELESAWAVEVIRGVENVVREEGMSVVLSESTDTHRVTRSAPEPAIPQAAVASAGPRS
ncbi:hypothetical protein BIV25_20185 [Streptomyces sp. MUSC 14]|nr:hypothetical protein BIV25_20185 [Streptomyces sp. MUSC 14]